MTGETNTRVRMSLTQAVPRWSTAVPFAIAGGVSVVAGGLAAAVTSVVGFEHGAWVAAYLVLVTGVAQIAIGAGQALLAPVSPSRRVVAAEVSAWNAGSAAVIIGTLLDTVPLVDLGGVLLVVVMALLVATVRGARGRGGWWLRGYWALIGVLVVSVPVGLLLARL